MRRRMLAIALVLEGADRTTAAQTCGMDRQTRRDWMHHTNAEGIESLSNPSAGPTPRLSAGQRAELALMVREGPEFVTDGVVRGRIDLKRRIEDRFGVAIARADGLKAAGGPRLAPPFVASAVPQIRPGSAGGIQENLAATTEAALSQAARGRPLEIWFQDEARGSAGNAHPDPGRTRNPPPCVARHPLRRGVRPLSRTNGVRGLTFRCRLPAAPVMRPAPAPRP